eukprot:EG_transcript_38632
MVPDEPPSSSSEGHLRGPRRHHRNPGREEGGAPCPASRAPEGLIPADFFDRAESLCLTGPHCCFFVTCLGGLEDLVQDEIADVFGAEPEACGAVLGKVYLIFCVAGETNDFCVTARQLLSLRCIEGVYWVLGCQRALSPDATAAERQLRDHAGAI